MSSSTAYNRFANIHYQPPLSTISFAQNRYQGFPLVLFILSNLNLFLLLQLPIKIAGLNIGEAGFFDSSKK